MNPVLSILVGGILPFGVVFIERFFILTSIWLNQFYDIFGFLFVVFVILLVTPRAQSAILLYVLLPVVQRRFLLVVVRLFDCWIVRIVPVLVLHLLFLHRAGDCNDGFRHPLFWLHFAWDVYVLCPGRNDWVLRMPVVDKKLTSNGKLTRNSNYCKMES
ncbi:hypothetical protein RHMOL_Rhmol05G0020200 [Rhododendron molle]|uniref:Uncharacterized protein n=1 Tax=Rhododendron molle TaxID=49168 RepID=A0ACC0NJW4_RHOML|nr:hypothetical protein RHMOL_Rhmol05G0020200 [Rhododendron molle]